MGVYALLAYNQFVHPKHSWLLRSREIFSTLERDILVRTSLSCNYQPHIPFRFWPIYAVW